MQPDIHEQTQGRWRGILSQFGMSQKELSGKHGPCPMCQGTDRFRFDDKQGRGTWFCNSCGAGSGIDLVMKLRGWDFKKATQEVRPLVGMASAEPIKAGMSDQDKRRLRMDLWQSSQPIQQGDGVSQYLAGRGLDQPTYPVCLRTCNHCRYSATQNFTAMIAAVQDEGGQGVSLHRTFILDGVKAPVDNPRMMMPGSIPNGSAVRLGQSGSVLGIAEGIESAIAASNLFEMPVWASLTAGLLAEWEPPQGVSEVVIFGDNDASFTGQSAAYQLARRMDRKKLTVSVQIPDTVGEDWNDIWVRKSSA